ncbi:hypothetical protein [Streptomyces sp. NPDC091215]|uniref:hypothetical protein n=1 Tax=Streptomyces sp. NPDC091215 TaxID=3155192 RepID=UPI0034337EFE
MDSHQVAERLNRRVCNIGSGRATTRREIVEAITAALAEVRFELPEGGGSVSASGGSWLDISRLRQDTGFKLQYDTERAVAEYIDWLRAGTERRPHAGPGRHIRVRG